MQPAKIIRVMRLLRQQLLGVFCLALCAANPAQAKIDVETQRQQFEAAEKALQAGQHKTFERLKRQLRGYPLYPYLEYADIKRKLDSVQTRKISRFLLDHHDTPLADRLRDGWLDRLAKRGQWREYLLFYEPDSNVSRRCHYAQALLQTGNRARALDLAESLWLHGHSRPSSCDPVFKAWRESGRQTGQMVWRRIELAVAAGELRLAKYLERYLSNADKVWLNRWLRLHREPQQALRTEDFRDAHPYRERILGHAVGRLSRFDEYDALALWAKLEPRYPFSADDRYDIERQLALALADEDSDRAYQFLQAVTPRAEDQRLQTALLLAALRRHDWPGFLTRLERLPQDLAELERWRYWRGRALEQVGRGEEARTIFQGVARERSYYGFLAADRADLPYTLDHADTPVEPNAIERIEALGATRRAREFLALNRSIEARREWRYLQQSLDKAGLRAAAKIAQDWGWQDQAIFTLAKSGYWDDLELRFPLEHGETVFRHSDQNELEPAWVYAVIRQESAFNRKAHSPAGARGLMQLMPATARLVATRLLNRRAPRRTKLYDPAVNIDLGTTYLRHVLDQLGDHPVLATALADTHWLVRDRTASFPLTLLMLLA